MVRLTKTQPTNQWEAALVADSGSLFHQRALFTTYNSRRRNKATQQVMVKIKTEETSGEAYSSPYWSRLEQEICWLDGLGVVLIVCGVLAIALGALGQSWSQHTVPFPFLGKWWHMSPPILLVGLGISCCVRKLKKNVSIPVVRAIYRVFVTSGLLLTQVGIRLRRVCAKGLKWSPLLMALALFCLYKAHDIGERDSYDEKVRTGLVRFIDENHFSPYAASNAWGFADAISADRYRSFPRRRADLHTASHAVANIFGYSGNPDPINDEMLKENLRQEALRLESQIAQKSLESVDNLSPPDRTDRLLLITVALQVENKLSVDGKRREHTLRAIEYSKQGRRLLERIGGSGEASESRLMPESLHNALANARVAHFMVDSETTADIETRARELASARSYYAHNAASADSNSFCRSRSLNNLVSFDLRALSSKSSKLLTRLSELDSDFRESYEMFSADPREWMERSLGILGSAELLLPFPEISITRTQVISLVAQTIEDSSSTLCGSDELARLRRLAKRNLRIAIGRGFSYCDFFETPVESGLGIMRLCLNEDQAGTLCELVTDFFRDEASCRICA